MTTGIALTFIFASVIGLVAIMGGIWLEQRMPDPQHQRITARSLGPAPPDGLAARRPPGPAASIGGGQAHPYGRHHR